MSGFEGLQNNQDRVQPIERGEGGLGSHATERMQQAGGAAELQRDLRAQEASSLVRDLTGELVASQDAFDKYAEELPPGAAGQRGMLGKLTDSLQSLSGRPGSATEKELLGMLQPEMQQFVGALLLLAPLIIKLAEIEAKYGMQSSLTISRGPAISKQPELTAERVEALEKELREIAKKDLPRDERELAKDARITANKDGTVDIAISDELLENVSDGSVLRHFLDAYGFNRTMQDGKYVRVATIPADAARIRGLLARFADVLHPDRLLPGDKRKNEEA